MKATPPRTLPAIATLLALVFSASQDTHAQAVYYDRPLSQLIDNLGTPPVGVNGTRWITRGDANATVDLANDNTIGWFTPPGFSPQNLNWQAGGYSAQFQYNIFASMDSTRRNLFLQHQDIGEVTPRPVSWTIQHATFENVTFDPTNVSLITDGGASSASWTLNNSKIAGGFAGHTPRIVGTAPFTLSAIGSQQSELYQFSPESAVSSQTTLLVNNAGGLLFNQVGDADNIDAGSAYRFNNSANTYDINGSTLHLQDSHVLFHSGNTPTVTAGTVTEGFVVRNGGTLRLSGTTTGPTRMIMANGSGLLIENSTLSLDNNATLAIQATSIFRLSNAVVNMGTLGTQTKVTADGAFFSGTNTINTASLDVNYGFSSGIILQDANTTLNINQRGTVVANSSAYDLTLNGGVINVNENANLRVTAPFRIQTSGFLNISTHADFTMDQSSTAPTVPAIMYLEDAAGNPLVITNNGYMRINDILEAKGTIHGAGILDINNTGTLRLAAGESSFTVEGDSWIKGKLQLTLDPTAGTSQHLDVSGLTLGEVYGGIPLSEPTLSLTLVNDTLLSEGTKFLLIDYESRNSSDEIFDSLPDGEIFQRGLNHYKILYADPLYNSKAVTLTVMTVPEPSTYALLALSAAGLGGYVLRRRRN